MIVVRKVSAASIPLPDPGKAILFCDVADGHYKIKQDNGNIVDLEAGAVGSVQAINVLYTAIPTSWTWAASVPTEAQTAISELALQVTQLTGLISSLAPPQPTHLSALALGVSATYFQGKIPSGLPASWYTQNVPGDIVNFVVYNGTYGISATGFYVGSQGNLSTYGQLSYLKNAVVANTIDMTLTPTGSSGPLTIAAVHVISGFWESADATVSVVQTIEGLEKHQLSHTNSGASSQVLSYLDDNVIAPSFSAAVAVTQNTKVSKWLSGIEYYGAGSTFNVSYSVANAFRKVYVPVGLSVITCPGVTAPHTVDPVVTPAYTDTFVITGHLLTLNAANQASLAPILTVTIAKPNNANVVSNSFNIKTLLGLGIDTYGIVSTTTTEFFQDEAQRLNIAGLTPFVSTAVLINGEAQVRAGTLVYGNIDYPAKAGDQQYTRRFVKAAANSGQFIFPGLTTSNISPYGTGGINVILILETEGKYFDLGQPFGANNGTGDGLSLANSKGGRVSIAGNNLNWTIGTNTTSNNGNQYRLLIIFKNATYSLTGITAS